LFANFKGQPAAVAKAWSRVGDNGLKGRLQQLDHIGNFTRQKDPAVAKVIDAVQAELTTVHSNKELVSTLGLSQSPSYIDLARLFSHLSGLLGVSL